MYNHIMTSVIGHSKVISFAGHLTYIIYLIPFWILTWTNVLTDQFLQLDILILRKWLGPAHRTEHIFFSLYGYFTSLQLNFFPATNILLQSYNKKWDNWTNAISAAASDTATTGLGIRFISGEATRLQGRDLVWLSKTSPTS